MLACDWGGDVGGWWGRSYVMVLISYSFLPLRLQLKTHAHLVTSGIEVLSVNERRQRDLDAYVGQRDLLARKLG